MIISKTPYRISFFGGGTDFPQWYRENGGAVLSSTIDKYCYISCRRRPPFFEAKHRFVYSEIENVNEIEDIRHPSIRAVLHWLRVSNALEIHHDGDLPARSGLGSSSSFTAGLLNVMRAMDGKIYSKEELARDTIHVEQNVIGETVGSQDQMAVVYGGLNKIEFRQDMQVVVQPVILSGDRIKQLNAHLLLFYTGIQRFAENIEKEKIKSVKANYGALKNMHEMVGEAMTILRATNFKINDFGKMLHESWLLKRSLSSKVSNDVIDEIYATALKAGATGGKVLGAGGGGFFMVFAQPKYHEAIIQKLEAFIHVPFKFEYQGSHISLYTPEVK